eukprot:1360497-Amorphochlora_amoeboformis.AAC.1
MYLTNCHVPVYLTMLSLLYNVQHHTTVIHTKLSLTCLHHAQPPSFTPSSHCHVCHVFTMLNHHHSHQAHTANFTMLSLSGKV